MANKKVWAELAWACEAKGIAYSQEDDAKDLRAKLKSESNPEPEE